jgi:hypothetical protein
MNHSFGVDDLSSYIADSVWQARPKPPFSISHSRVEHFLRFVGTMNHTENPHHSALYGAR